MPFGKFFQRKMSAAEKRVAQTNSYLDLTPVKTISSSKISLKKNIALKKIDVKTKPDKIEKQIDKKTVDKKQIDQAASKPKVVEDKLSESSDTSTDGWLRNLKAELTAESLITHQQQAYSKSNHRHSKYVTTKYKNRTGSSAPAAGVVAAEQAQPNGPGANIRGSPEYSVAFELEVWKKAEETKFRAHLKEQENNMRDQLDRAFAEKEKAREQQWSQQQREFANVESRLRKQLGEVQQREARVSSEEERLKRTYDLQTSLLLEDVDRSAKHQLEEYLSAARRAQEESEHKVKLEQDKVASGQRRIADLEQDLQIQRKRYLELEQELESFRREARNQGLSNLQADLRLRDYRIQELENKLQSAVASRDHFKNAFQEMALKAGQYVPPAPSDAGVPQSPMVEPSASSLGANTVGTNLSRPPASGGLKSDEFVEVLRSMKNEFANLGEKVAASPAPTARTVRTNFIDSTPRPATALNSDADPMSIRKNLDAELEEKDPKIAALEKQRSELLSTGLYNMNDKLIQALDRKIQNGGE